jgi:hypothetical protein
LLCELNDVVFADGSVVGQGYGEYLAHRPHSLASLGLRQVVIAVPPGLRGRICDQLEDRLWTGGDLKANADHTRILIIPRHAAIETHA